ncbi:phospholipid-binding lipoprotein MlaA [Variovorax paradoxus]|nr:MULTISPECIES: VacJ family lipoprotein [Variovorax]MDR6522101.1 phospholipid-binding lipoprotein MlaA [Variovorax paradoxus]
MKTPRLSLLIVMLMVTSAQAHAVEKYPDAPTTPVMMITAPLDATTVIALESSDARDSKSAMLHSGAASGSAITAEAETSNLVDSDPDLISTKLPVQDPWENFNRKVHGFNTRADRLVLRPLAVGYDEVVPDGAKAGVSRFFANLGSPVTILNEVLQGRFGHAAQSLGRFVTNTTVGIGGVFDPAAQLGMPKRHSADFGQTLATWGWEDSRYLVVPIFGPRTIRDTIGLVSDQALSPINQIQESGALIGLQVLETIDGRTQLLPLDRFRRDAIDDYIFVRDVWAQRRNQQIHADLRNASD